MAGRPPLPIGTWGQVTVTGQPGAWRARARFRDVDGVTRSVVRTGATKGAARNALTDHFTERVAPAGDDLTAESPIEQAVLIWIADREAADLASNTLRRYREVADDHVRPGLGAVRLREATVPRLEAYLRGLATATGAPTARLARTVLSGAFTIATRHGALRQNPMRDVAGVTVTRKDPHALTVEQVRAVRAAITAWQNPPPAEDGKPRRGRPRTTALIDLVDFILATAVRIGEALAVRWSDVDLEAGTVTIAGTLAWTDEKPARLYRQAYRKGDTDHVVHTLPDHAVTMLTRRRIAADGNAHDVVFPTAAGTLWDQNNVRKTLRKALQPAGLEWITPHELRRTVATEVDRAHGLRAAAEVMGNSEEVARRHYVERKALAPDVRGTLDAFFA